MDTARDWGTEYAPLGPLTLIFGSLLTTELRKKCGSPGPTSLYFLQGIGPPFILEAPETFLGASGICIWFNW